MEVSNYLWYDLINQYCALLEQKHFLKK